MRRQEVSRQPQIDKEEDKIATEGRWKYWVASEVRQLTLDTKAARVEVCLEVNRATAGVLVSLRTTLHEEIKRVATANGTPNPIIYIQDMPQSQFTELVHALSDVFPCIQDFSQNSECEQAQVNENETAPKVTAPTSQSPILTGAAGS